VIVWYQREGFNSRASGYSESGGFQLSNPRVCLSVDIESRRIELGVEVPTSKSKLVPISKLFVRFYFKIDLRRRVKVRPSGWCRLSLHRPILMRIILSR